MSKLLINLILMLFGFCSMGQQIMYRDVKKEYNTKDYTYIANSKYNIGAGIALNIVLPGTGHIYANETTRGLGFMGGYLVAATASTYGLLLALDPVLEFDNIDGDQELGKKLFLTGSAISIGIIGWSIYDINKVIKVKNMAYAQKNTSRSLLEIKPICFYNGSSYKQVNWGCQLVYKW